MPKDSLIFSNGLDSSFKVYHDLMVRKVRDILLVSTPYDAWIMEQDGRLSERIVNEYRGLNLSKPPRLGWTASAEGALEALAKRSFDMVITMPRVADADAYALGQQIKAAHPNMPVILLSHSVTLYDQIVAAKQTVASIDRRFVWSGDTDLLVAIVKSTEDRMNADADTELAGVRVILFVENSPRYASLLLPILYKELVVQTRSVLEGRLNEEHRLLTMRARPKIIMAETYEEAMHFFERYEPYVLGVISDVEFPRAGELNKDAGCDLLCAIKARRFDIPLLLTSADTLNAARAQAIPAAFLDKNSPNLQAEVQSYFKQSLAFGDFIFRLPDGREVARASDLRTFEQCLHTVPAESLLFHGRRNDFSRWLFTRTETALAAKLRDISVDEYPDVDKLRQRMINLVRSTRTERQRGVIADFDAREYDRANRFIKIGQGSMGGKARGLAFSTALLRQNASLRETFDQVRIFVPRTLVITTEAFADFVTTNHLSELAEADLADEEIARRFSRASLPTSLENDLRAYLGRAHHPLAVRSSSLLEDAQFRAYAGLYRTYMLPNEHERLDSRLHHLVQAIKLVYASTYFAGPKSFSHRVGRHIKEEQMAVLIQHVVGERYGEYVYPAISGVAQSINYYPFGRMKPDEGIATIALGFGRAVVEGEKTLRFSPAHPQLLPQRSSVEDILDNTQRYFYALRMGGHPYELGTANTSNLIKREVSDAADEVMHMLASTFVPEENRIRDTAHGPGHRVLTFSPILKHRRFPLAEIISQLLPIGRQGMGAPIELEFSVNFRRNTEHKPEFAILQLRPMTARADLADVEISAEEIAGAFCFSTAALGNVAQNHVADILYVKPDAFDRSRTQDIARQIGRFNAGLVEAARPYLLIGPGRWGTADRWLGIPVTWNEISGVAAIVETPSDHIRAEPSQGSHFFHNITTLGINYVTVGRGGDDFLDWDWLLAQPLAGESDHVAHVRLDTPLTSKVDGRTSRCVICQYRCDR
ncbi:MAG: hypothetical protein J5I90_14835 [Caldilineales bacterium]|nr:hypothetical protein [Caldilineales bacterium]